MSLMDTEAETAAQYVPFTPFQRSHEFEAEPPSRHAGTGFSPFLSEYAGDDATSAEAAELHELLHELYDEEFDEVLADLAHEAWEAVNERAVPLGETGFGASEERFLQEWSEPVRLQAEALLDNIAETLAEEDYESLDEAGIDMLFEEFELYESGLEPHFENFLGGLVSKAKKLAKKAVSVAKKGIALFPGLGLLLKKLKALVRPLLQRVLKTAIDRLPPELRPVARQLAQRLTSAKILEAEADEELEGAAAAPDVGALQQQFDLEAATLMFAGSEVEQEVIATDAAHAADQEQAGTVGELQEARERLADELEAGVTPETALEHFIPAVMAVLPVARTAIKLAGRQRIVNFLAKALAGYISRYVPREQSDRLSRAIVDAGLRTLSLEVEDEAGLAFETLVQTAEDTVRRVVEFGEAELEDPVLLEAAVAEAFNEAAAENFPPALIVAELHESDVRATWVARPAGAQRKQYKKYTHVFDVEITPQIAAAVTTFGGASLAAFLRQQLGVTAPVRARVHLYQAIAGTTLPRIARLERDLPGLASTPRLGARQLHPLTVKAAGMLLRQPGLGREVAGRFRSSRRSVAIGARFYYLEIPGARPLTVTRGVAGRSAVARASQVRVTLDFPRDEYRAAVYFSEADAQELAATLRSKNVPSALVIARRVYRAGLAVALGGEFERRTRIVAEAAVDEELAGRPLRRLPAGSRQRLHRRIEGWVGKALAEHLQNAAAEFVAASENPAEGVTVLVRIGQPTEAPLLRALLRGAKAVPPAAAAAAAAPKLSASSLPGLRLG